MEKKELLSKIVKNLLPLFIYFNLPFLLIGQSAPTIDFTNIKKEDGLLNNTVNKVIKCDLGFIWIATNQGLHRYDGPNTMTVFKIDTINNSNSLASNIISTLFNDSKGNVWIGTSYGGLTKYNSYNSEWKTYRYQEEDSSSISNDEILCIYEDSQQRLWIGTENGLNLFNYESETFTCYTADDADPYSLATNAVLSIMEDDKAWLWVGTWAGGLHLLLEHNEKEAKFLNFKPTSSKQSHNVWTMYQDRDGRYWVGTFGGGLFLMQLPSNASNKINHTNWTPNFYNYVEDKSNPFSMSNGLISDIEQDRSGVLWIGTTYGLNSIQPMHLPDTSIYNYANKEGPSIDFKRHYSDSENVHSISNNTIKSVVEDDEGIIWIGTANGLSQHNWYTNQFEFHRLYDENDLVPNASNIYVDDNEIVWTIAGNKGLFNYNLKDKTLQSFSEKHPTLFLDKSFLAIQGTAKKKLYVATDLGFSIIDLTDLSAKKYRTPDWFRKKNPNLYIQSFYVDDDKQLWFGTEHGLYVFDIETETYSSYERNIEQTKSISDNSITSIYRDKTGDLWVGTYSGLNRIRGLPSGKLEFRHFYHDSNNPTKSISSNQITALQAIDNRLYIGTTAGLSSYSFENDEFESYGSNNQNFWIQSLVKTKEGNLWASTIEGLFYFDTKTKVIVFFDTEDGIKDTSFSLDSNTEDTFGYIYFGNAIGFMRFHPDSVRINDKEPPVYITNVKKINSKGEKIIEGINLKEIELNYNDYYLAINFAGLNYIRPEKNLFAYQLLGFDDKWYFTKSDIPIVYTNLEPKSYTLTVKAANNSNVWNEDGVVLHINKNPAFWQTWLFRLGSLLVLVTLIFLGLQFYTNTQRKNIKLAQMNEEISLAKLRSLTINMNPHFLFNAFNTLQNFILKNEKHNANQYLTNLSDIIRKLLNNSESIATPLLEEIEILTAYVKLEKERFAKNIDFKLVVDPILLDRNPIIPSMIIQPHLENAILHGLSSGDQDGKITLVLTEKEEGNLHCIIRDNGIGRIKAQEKKKQDEHLSMATRNTNDRIDILKKMGYQNSNLEIKDLYDHKSIPLGTEIIITLPFLVTT